MKKTCLAAPCVAACVAVAVWCGIDCRTAEAQSPTVVVIDVSYIFKNHARFNQAMELMKRDAQEFEGQVRQQQKDLQTRGEQLKSFESGSVDYKRLEEDIAKGSSDLQVRMTLKRKEFFEREAKLYYNTYNEVFHLVSQFAQRNAIRLVLRYNSEPIKAEDRQSVIQGVNRAVVYQRDLDITMPILEQCNREAPPTEIGRPQIPGGTNRR